MKVIIFIVLCILSKANRLLQQSGCAVVRCSSDRPNCYETPISGTPRCCAVDSLCEPEDYQIDSSAICLDDSTDYENKCFGRCEGNNACGKLCKCDSDLDCGNGYSCRETPFGFAGCDENIGNSCFGFCVKVGSSCGGFVGLALCTEDETCVYTDTTGSPTGYCASLPPTCDSTASTTPTPTICGSIKGCAVFSDGCNTCDCGVDGSATVPKCTTQPCPLNVAVPHYCTQCITGYSLDSTGACVPGCGGIPYCTSYKPDPCNVCGCNGGTEYCTLAYCGDPSLFPNECTVCIDGYHVNSVTKQCDKDCICTKEYIPVCCNGVTYSNQCIAECYCSDTITTGECPISPATAPTLPPGCATILCAVNTNCCDDGNGGVRCCPNKVPCKSKADCNAGSICRRDPECRGSGSTCSDKYCIILGENCTTDQDCAFDEICYPRKGNPICMKYQSP